MNKQLDPELRRIANDSLAVARNIGAFTLNPTNALATFKTQLITGRALSYVPVRCVRKYAQCAIEESTHKLTLAARKKNSTSTTREVLFELDNYLLKNNYHHSFNGVEATTRQLLETVYVITKEEDNSITQIERLLSGSNSLFSANQLRLNLLVDKLQRLDALVSDLETILDA